MHPSVTRLLRCPDHCRPLTLHDALECDGDVISGLLACSLGHTFAIISGIPRFVPEVADTVTRQVYDHLWQRKAHAVGWDGLTEGETPEAFVRARLALPPRPRGLALDVGCGDGRHAAALAATGLHVIAVDISTSAVEIGRAYAPGVQFVQADALALPFPDEVADYVFACGSLHHTAAPRAAFNHAVRVCRPSATLYAWLYDAAPRGHAPLIRGLARAPYLAKRVVAAALLAANRLRRRLGGANPVTHGQSSDEVAWWILDEIGPEHRHLIPETQARAWFAGAAFEQITVRDRFAYGYGIRGVRATTASRTSAVTASLTSAAS